jgi:MoxR-like ATPase
MLLGAEIVVAVMLTADQVREAYSRTSSTQKYGEWRADRVRRIARFQTWLLDVQGQGTDDEVRQGFLDHFEDGFQSLNPIFRDRIIRDVPRFREAVKELLAESVPVSQRLDQALEGDRHIEGMGHGLATEYLMIARPDKYCIWNEKSKSGLEALDRWPVFSRGQSPGQRYEHILQAVQELRDQIGSPDFPDTDQFLHFVGAPEDEGKAALAAISQSQGSSRPVVADHPTPNPPSVWWVNQGTTYSVARDGAFLWAPKLGRDGRPRDHWLRLRELRPDDIVLHNADGRIRAVSHVVLPAVDATKPDSLANEEWGSEGLRVRTDYRELRDPIVVADIPAALRTPSAGPFTVAGGVKQGYIFPLSRPEYDELCRLHPELAEGNTTLSKEDFGTGATRTISTPYAEPPWDSIMEQIRNSGLSFDDAIIRRYHLSLKSRRIVILAGVSGTGKTSLALVYARAIGAVPLLVPVAPNWTTNEDLLGCFNVLNGKYSDTDFSRFLRAAEREFREAKSHGVDARPYHVILDEMNLARIEYYFAKLLSVMEINTKSGARSIELGPDDHVELTPNLSVIGTINVDETTQGFSDKVYDRAQVVELPLKPEAIRSHLNGAIYADELFRVWETVKTVAPFAYRVLDDIRAYIDHAQEMGESWESALDEQVVQKVLPKLNRTDSAVRQALTELEIIFTSDKFPLSREKTQYMLRGCIENGFASYF